MHRLFHWSLAATLLPFLIGCGDSAPDSIGNSIPVQDAAAVADAGRRIGTIDLRRIYVTLGLQQQRITRKDELNTEINLFREDARTQVQKKLAEFGGDAQALTEDQRKVMQSLDAELTNELRKKTAEAQQTMSELDQFLQRILSQKTSKPIQKIADQRHLDIVLIHRPDSFAFIRPDADITDEILTEIGAVPSIQDTP